MNTARIRIQDVATRRCQSVQSNGQPLPSVLRARSQSGNGVMQSSKNLTRSFITACVCVFLASSATKGLAGVLASSGFNDATGIYSDPFLGSPFVKDVTVDHQGDAEAGWGGPWQRLGGFDDRAHVVSEYQFEGDQSVTLWADRVFGTSIERNWKTIVPKIRVDAYVLATPAARMGGQLVRSCCGEIPSRTVAAWIINGDGTISLYDPTLADFIATPFSTLPYEWNKYSLIADTRTKTWQFAFNDVIFHRASPMKFVTNSSFIDAVNFSAVETRTTYVDYVTVTAVDAQSGDVNGDGLLNGQDIDEITLAVRANRNDLGYDSDGNGLLNSADREDWVVAKKRTYYGDADLNGVFDSGDMILVFQAGLYEDKFALNANWASGDWNGDGDFTTDDMVVAFAQGGYGNGPRPAASAVPEPSSMIFLGLGLLGIRQRLRRCDSAS